MARLLKPGKTDWLGSRIGLNASPAPHIVYLGVARNQKIQVPSVRLAPSFHPQKPRCEAGSYRRKAGSDRVMSPPWGLTRSAPKQCLLFYAGTAAVNKTVAGRVVHDTNSAWIASEHGPEVRRQSPSGAGREAEGGLSLRFGEKMTVKPCKICGSTDRYPSGGCKRCVARRHAKWMAGPLRRVVMRLPSEIEGCRVIFRSTFPKPPLARLMAGR